MWHKLTHTQRHALIVIFVEILRGLTCGVFPFRYSFSATLLLACLYYLHFFFSLFLATFWYLVFCLDPNFHKLSPAHTHTVTSLHYTFLHTQAQRLTDRFSFVNGINWKDEKQWENRTWNERTPLDRPLPKRVTDLNQWILGGGDCFSFFSHSFAIRLCVH